MQDKRLFFRSFLLHIDHIWLPHDFRGLGNSDFNCLGFRTSRGSLWLLHLFLFGSHWEPASRPRDLVHQLHVLGSRLLGDKCIVADFAPESLRLIYPPKSHFKIRVQLTDRASLPCAPSRGTPGSLPSSASSRKSCTWTWAAHGTPCVSATVPCWQCAYCRLCTKEGIYLVCCSNLN